MNRHWTMIAATVLLLPLAAGCAQKKTETASEQTPPAEQQAAMEVAGQSTPPADMVLTAMTLEGKVGCGHCTYHTTDACALAMQTEDGKVYVIESAPNYDEYFGDRFSGKGISVTGKVGEKEGNWVIYAEQVELR